MRYEFCTVCSRQVLPQVLVLHDTLADACKEFRLSVVCMDRESETVLAQRRSSTFIPIPVRDLERYDRALAEVKPSRSLPEYCWTLKASLCLYVLDREPDVALIAYVDADHAFASDPTPVFEELGSDSILLVPHRVAGETPQ